MLYLLFSLLNHLG